MARRKRKSTLQKRLKKPLLRGKIYKLKDSNGGHYSTIYKKNIRKNKYWTIHFTDSDGRHRIKLKHQINPQLEKKANSYVYTQPSVVKYERFNDPYPRENLRIHKDDRKTVKQIKKKKWWDPRAC